MQGGSFFRSDSPQLASDGVPRMLAPSLGLEVVMMLESPEPSLAWNVTNTSNKHYSNPNPLSNSMALIYCRECGKKYSDQASACPECACPSEGTSPQVSVLPDGSAADRCSSCGSTALQRYSFVYAQGTSGSSGSMFGVGGSSSSAGGAIASASVQASSISVSGLAALTAPPERLEREPLALWKTICLVWFFFPVGLIYYFVVHKPALARWEEGESERSAKFVEACLEYELQWLCMDCGTNKKITADK